MSESPPSLHYQEQRDYTLLEDVLRARRLGFTGWITVVASVLAIALALHHVFPARWVRRKLTR